VIDGEERQRIQQRPRKARDAAEIAGRQLPPEEVDEQRAVARPGQRSAFTLGAWRHTRDWILLDRGQVGWQALTTAIKLMECIAEDSFEKI